MKQMRNQPVNMAWRAPKTGLISIVGFGLALLFLSTIAGLLAVVLPWFIIVPLVLVSLSLILAFHYPEFAVAALLAAMFGAFPNFILPSIPVAGGSVRPEDLGLFVFLLILLMRHVGNLRSRLWILKPYIAPIVALLIMALVSTMYSFFIGKAPAKDILNEARSYYAWLIFPLFPLAIDNENRMRRFGRLLVILALFLAVAGIFQAMTGVHIFQRDQMMSVVTVAESYGGIARSVSPGVIFVAAVFIYVCAAYTMRPKPSAIGSFVIGSILLGGVIVSFTRALWVSVLVGLLLLALYARQSRYMLMLGAILVSGFAALSTVAVYNPTYFEAITDRLLTINSEIKEGTSFGRRKIELSYAVPKVLDNPFVGVGMGGKYKPHTLDAIGWEGETRYIHNMYAAVATKLGIPGLVALLWLVAVMLWRSWGMVRRREGDRPVVFACWWVLLTSTIFVTLTQPILASSFGVATVALALFMMEWRPEAPKSATTPVSPLGPRIAAPRAGRGFAVKS